MYGGCVSVCRGISFFKSAKSERETLMKAFPEICIRYGVLNSDCPLVVIRALQERKKPSLNETITPVRFAYR